MSGYKSFIKNVGLLTIANFGSKILVFLLVPLYTNVLSTSDYGTYDLVFNTVSILVPLLTQNIIDGVLRFALDKDVNKDKVIDIGLKYFAISIFPVILILLLNIFFEVLPQFIPIEPYFFVIYVSQALSGIVLYYVRGLNRFKEIAFSSVLCSALVILCNIFFLIVFKLGLNGYFLANVIGPFVQIGYLFFILKGYRPNFIHVDRVLERQMLIYSRPLIANTVAWWFNNVFDRYIVTFFCGVAENGIYAVASKIPSILSVFQNIIGQAWIVSATDEFDPKDTNGFFTKMYNLYNSFMVLLGSTIIAANLLLAKIMYANEFYIAWKYAPFLTLSIVFGAVSGYVGGIMGAVKDSAQFAKSTVIGSFVNVILNLILVPYIGAFGSALSTLLCYIVIWALRMKSLSKYITLHLSLFRDCFSYLILFVQCVLMLLLYSNYIGLYISEALCFLSIIFLYNKELNLVLRKIIAISRKENDVH